MLKMILAKIPYWNTLPLYIKIILLIVIMFIFVSFAIKKHNETITNNYIDYHLLEQKILMMKEQVQNIDFLILETINTENRNTIKDIIIKNKAILNNISNALIHLQLSVGENIKALSQKEQNSLLNAYDIMNICIKKLKNNMELIQIAPEFSNISLYIQELQKVSQIMRDFPAFYYEYKADIKNFSLKGE